MPRKVKILSEKTKNSLENKIQEFLNNNTEAELISISYAVVPYSADIPASWDNMVNFEEYEYSTIIIYRTEE